MNKTTCPNCGQPSATGRGLSKYHYKECGLDNVWLHGGVTETDCSNCGEKSISIVREPQLLQVIALDLLMEAKSCNGSELRFLRRACGLTQDELASLLKMPRRATIAERERKRNPGLAFAEEVGLRWILLRAFHEHVTKPGNSALEASQLERLFAFAGFFDRFAANIELTHRYERINARVRADVWTVEKKAA